MVDKYAEKYYKIFPCVDCGKLHHVQIIHGKPKNPRCLSCAAIIRGTGRVCSPETRAKISASLMGHKGSCGMLGKHVTEEAKAKRKRSLAGRIIVNGWKGKHWSEEDRKRIGENSKRAWQNEEYKKRMSQITKERIANYGHPMKGKHHRQDSIERIRKNKLGSHVSEEARLILKQSKSSDEFRRKQSDKMKLIHADPNSVYNSSEYRAKMLISHKTSWNDPNSRQRSPEVMGKRVDRLMNYIKNKKLCNYNKMEAKLDRIIQKILPNQYGYNGGTQLGLRIHYHTPDFVNINGQKKLIELNGCVWHCCPICGITKHPMRQSYKKVRDRDERNIRDAEALGYKVLTIWEHDMKNKFTLEKKLLEFNNA